MFTLPLRWLCQLIDLTDCRVTTKATSQLLQLLDHPGQPRFELTVDKTGMVGTVKAIDLEAGMLLVERDDPTAPHPLFKVKPFFVDRISTPSSPVSPHYYQQILSRLLGCQVATPDTPISFTLVERSGNGQLDDQQKGPAPVAITLLKAFCGLWGEVIDTRLQGAEPQVLIRYDDRSTLSAVWLHIGLISVLQPSATMFPHHQASPPGPLPTVGYSAERHKKPCPQCQSTNYQPVDEPTTQAYTCDDCFHRWIAGAPAARAMTIDEMIPVAYWLHNVETSEGTKPIVLRALLSPLNGLSPSDQILPQRIDWFIARQQTYWHPVTNTFTSHFSSETLFTAPQQALDAYQQATGFCRQKPGDESVDWQEVSHSDPPNA